ncbi:MAG: hypothetical protein JNK05_15985 [Myxococcales bacterium]|nr:hypothetical protein [Myxococcales bacterium]
MQECLDSSPLRPTRDGHTVDVHKPARASRASQAPGARRALQRGFAAVVACAAIVAEARDANAQGANALARRELIAEAETASRAGDSARAIALAERAGAIQWTPSLRLFVANEYQRAGRIVDALSSAATCEREAQADAALRNRETIEQACSALAQSLRARVARITVQIPADAPESTEVRVAGHLVARPLWNVPYAVDPGSIAVEVTAPAMRVVRRVLSVGPGANETLSIVFERDPGATAAATPDTHIQTSSPRVALAPTPVASVAPARARERARPSIAPWLVVGAGGAAMVSSGVLAMLYASAIGELSRVCTDTSGGSSAPRGCPSTNAAERDQRAAQIRGAETLGTAAIVTVSLGGAAVAAGVAWAILGRPGREQPAQTTALVARPWLAHDGAGVAIGGTL